MVEIQIKLKIRQNFSQDIFVSSRDLDKADGTSVDGANDTEETHILEGLTIPWGHGC